MANDPWKFEFVLLIVNQREQNLKFRIKSHLDLLKMTTKFPFSLIQQNLFEKFQGKYLYNYPSLNKTLPLVSKVPIQ